MVIKIVVAIMLLIVQIDAKESKLRYVIDGDTVVFKSETCRLAFIDTPESKRNKKATRDVADCKDVSLDDIVQSGRYAKRYLKSVMRKGEVYNFKKHGSDRYGRSICEIFLSDGSSINDRLVKNGFAVPFWRYIKSGDVKKRMRENASFAKSEKKGLWRTNAEVMRCMSH